MPLLVRKVFAYVTHHGRLLVFRHPGDPGAGIQVPAGTVKHDETLEAALLREIQEETGLTAVQIVRSLGDCYYDVLERGEVHHRHYFHVAATARPPETWCMLEGIADGIDPIPFELFWVPMADGIPRLAPGHDHMLPALMGRTAFPQKTVSTL